MFSKSLFSKFLVNTVLVYNVDLVCGKPIGAMIMGRAEF